MGLGIPIVGDEGADLRIEHAQHVLLVLLHRQVLGLGTLEDCRAINNAQTREIRTAFLQTDDRACI